MYPSLDVLRWALEKLDKWRAGLPPRPLQTAFRLLLLKVLGVEKGKLSAAAVVGTGDFRDVCRKFLQVSFEEDGTKAKTGGEPHYFNPLPMQYVKAVGASDYAVGTMWTRSDVWRDRDIIDFRGDGQRRVVFKAGYLEKIARQLKNKKIPAVPLAVFLFRRPSDCGVDVSKVASLDDIRALFLQTFKLRPEEAAALFDFDASEAPPSPLMGTEPSRSEVLELLLSMKKFEESGGDLAVSIAVNWGAGRGVGAEPCGLIGEGRAFQQALGALESGKHLILLGPPGTGKTAIARCICETLKIPYDVVTATAEWTTFDTIGGYLPDPTLRGAGTSDPLNFFPAFVLEAIKGGRWLIIDEINRADIDKAFGELFTVLSNLGVGVRLPFKVREGERFSRVVLGGPVPGEEGVYHVPLPDSWRIIGTMNTFDKASLFQLSYALMRRFAFVEVPIPEQPAYQEILRSKAAVLKGVSERYHEEVLELLTAIFAPVGGRGLAELGLAVGPAIPIDMIDYIRKRREADAELESRLAVLEGLEIYLYPQFEGKDTKHDDIVKAVAEALGLTPDARARTWRSLQTWTGYEPLRD